MRRLILWSSREGHPEFCSEDVEAPRPLRFERYGLADLTGEGGAGLANLPASIAAFGCT